jgi:UDP-GlcNAc:undecaprenyl-phosphate GlcNAc-1-phosphate transferase
MMDCHPLLTIAVLATGPGRSAFGQPTLWYLAWPFGLALLVTLIAVPILRRVAAAYDLYDRPDAGLKPHHRPIPYLGGVALWAGWLAVLLAAMAIGWPGRGGPDAGAVRWEMAGLAVGGSVLMLVGLIDDIRHLPPIFRLLVQVAVAGLLLYAGIGRGVCPALLEPLGIGDWASSPGDWGSTSRIVALCLSGLFCILVLAGGTNSTNLIDGLDGLCAGIVGLAALGYLAMTGLLVGVLDVSTPAGSTLTRVGDGTIQAVLCAGLLGACAGFLLYNTSPASIFMGDSGSLLLGFSIAVLIISMTEQASWRGLIGALFIFGFPIFDTALAIARRWLHHKPLSIGDRSHFYDQLRDRGMPVRKTVCICYAIGLAFAALGCLSIFLPTPWTVAMVIGTAAILAIVCRHFGMLRVDQAAERSTMTRPP